jgi:hypothetical protein
MALNLLYIQKCATEHPSTCCFIRCLHNLLNVLVQIANKMRLQGKKSCVYKKEILFNVLTASATVTQILLLSETQMRQVRRLPLYNPVLPQGKIK